MSNWKKVGECGVDAGCIMLVDPCYVIGDAGDQKVTYQEFLKAYEKNGYDKPLKFCDGVVVSSGYGDGCYPVYVKKARDGRIAEVKVIFIKGE